MADITFAQAFAEIMSKEFGCTADRSNAVLDMVNHRVIEGNKIESKILRGIKTVLDSGIVYNEMGGFGDSEFSVYFKNEAGRRGFAPSRYVKGGNISDGKLREITCNYGILLVGKCNKCDKVAVNLDVELRVNEGGKVKKDIYDLVYCESCGKIFVKEYKRI